MLIPAIKLGTEAYGRCRTKGSIVQDILQKKDLLKNFSRFMFSDAFLHDLFSLNLPGSKKNFFNPHKFTRFLAELKHFDMQFPCTETWQRHVFSTL